MTFYKVADKVVVRRFWEPYGTITGFITWTSKIGDELEIRYYEEGKVKDTLFYKTEIVDLVMRNDRTFYRLNDKVLISNSIENSKPSVITIIDQETFDSFFIEITALVARKIT
jgi:hypothetical protein